MKPDYSQAAADMKEEEVRLALFSLKVQPDVSLYPVQKRRNIFLKPNDLVIRCSACLG